MADFLQTVGAQLQSSDDGTATIELLAGEQHLNAAGTVHGGLLATLADSAMGSAVRSVAGSSEVPATSQLTIAYLRPGREGPIAVTARVRKQGEHMLICDADVEQDGKALAHAVATFAILQR